MEKERYLPLSVEHIVKSRDVRPVFLPEPRPENFIDEETQPLDIDRPELNDPRYFKQN